ncbi:MAG: acyl--CoA ligase [Betaproteobacteria bacterium]|nr:acyl--CoA ligase [Betaproteobacteria bacterium]
MLLHHFFAETVAKFPDRIALVCDEQRYRYSELDAEIARVAGLLKARGVTHGDRVIIFLDNSVEFAVSVFAVLRLGAVFVPINPLTRQEKLTYVLNDSRARALVTQFSLRGAWQAAVESSSSLEICLVSNMPEGHVLPDRCINYSTALDNDQIVSLDSIATEHDLASILYTSGTTGHPKGVMLTHRNMVSALESVMTYLQLRRQDVIMCVLPLAFGYGLYHLFMATRLGATLVLEMSFAFPLKIAQRMTEEKVSVFPGVPTIYAQLLSLKEVPNLDLSSLRILTNAAAALPEEHIRQLRRAFPGAMLYSMYGLTECKRVSYLPPDQLDIRPSSIGRGMPNQELWLADEEGRRLPNGSIGELVVKGPHVMKGYWEQPGLTAERLRPDPDGGEGAVVLHTGDIFRTDNEGWLYFVARKDNIIKTRGEKVSPREVENAIYALPGVLEVAVTGMQDPILGTAIRALVVLKPGEVLSEREVIRHCHARLESFMVPKAVEFVNELPKTESGKIKTSQLHQVIASDKTQTKGGP